MPKILTIESIRLTNFRNFEKIDFRFCPGINLITGMNGVGKTNLLDSIHVLSFTKSGLNNLDKTQIKHGEEFYRIESQWLRSERIAKINLRFHFKDGKELTVDDKIIRSMAEHIGQFPLVMIHPGDTLLVTGHNEDRRKFMDMTLSQLDPLYLKSLIQYNKVMNQRNALLRSQETFEYLPMHLLDVYEQLLNESGQYIYKARVRFLQMLNPVFEEVHRNIAGDKENVHFTYKSDLHNQPLKELLMINRIKDFELGRTNVGIHRDKLQLFINNYPVNQEGSQGQIKSFVLALKLAQYQVMRELSSQLPILILDDIFDKIDQTRVLNILQLVGSTDYGQVFISDTHQGRISELTKTTILAKPILETSIQDNLQKSTTNQ